MIRRKTDAAKIISMTVKRFPSLSTSEISVSKLVRFVLAKQGALERKRFRKNIGDDARDYMNTSYFLVRLSKRSLHEISGLRCREMQRRLKEGFHPFSRLSIKNRNILLHLPASWVYGSANWLLNSRR